MHKLVRCLPLRRVLKIINFTTDFEVWLFLSELWANKFLLTYGGNVRFLIKNDIALSGIIDTADSSSAVSLTLQSQTQRYHWHYWFKLSGIIDTAESNSTVSLTLLNGIIDTAFSSSESLTLLIQAQRYFHFLKLHLDKLKKGKFNHFICFK